MHGRLCRRLRRPPAFSFMLKHSRLAFLFAFVPRLRASPSCLERTSVTDTATNTVRRMSTKTCQNQADDEYIEKSGE